MHSHLVIFFITKSNNIIYLNSEQIYWGYFWFLILTIYKITVMFQPQKPDPRSFKNICTLVAIKWPLYPFSNPRESVMVRVKCENKKEKGKKEFRFSGSLLLCEESTETGEDGNGVEPTCISEGVSSSSSFSYHSSHFQMNYKIIWNYLISLGSRGDSKSSAERKIEKGTTIPIKSSKLLLLPRTSAFAASPL